ncbi:MAG: pyridoxamine 5'-phosphate oxidase family protein [Patescibacteria group bacterium]
MDKSNLVREFLNSQIHMVISTIGVDKPEAALVGFASADDLSLVFGTYTTTRKFNNIQKNPNCAIVFGNNEKITLQYEGVASVLEGDELKEYKNIYFQKTPSSKKYEAHPNQVYLKIKPTWIRYTDYNKEPEMIFEMNFFHPELDVRTSDTLN